MRHASLQNTYKNHCKNFDTFSNYIKRNLCSKMYNAKNTFFTLTSFSFAQAFEYLHLTLIKM